MLSGKVVWFDSGNRKYGQIQPVDGSARIFIHMGDRKSILCGRNNVRWRSPKEDRNPVEGELIIYEVSRSGGGRLKAKPWTFADEYAAAIESLAS